MFRHAEREAALNSSCDFLCVGGGLGGLVAAIRAHDLGLRVLVVEKTGLLGGVAAYSGGSIWAPNNPLQPAAGVADSIDDAMAYLAHLGDEKVAADMRLQRAFLKSVPDAIGYLSSIGVQLQVRGTPDMAYPEGAGSKPFGRTLEATFWGRDLGALIDQLRRSPYHPRAVTMQELVASGGSIDAALEALADVLAERRAGDYLTRGTGLVGALLHAAGIVRRIPIVTEARARELIVENDRVSGVIVEHSGAEQLIQVAKGVILATGGYGHAPFAAAMEGLPDYGEQAPPICDGDAIALASPLGAAVLRAGSGFFMPGFDCSVTKHQGTDEFAQHLLGSVSTPQSLIVNGKGERFGDETSQSSFMNSIRVSGGYGGARFVNWPAFYICDNTRAEGAEDGEHSTWPASDLVSAPDLAGLAGRLGIPPDRLAATVERFNGFARAGLDADFGRRSNLAPLARPPFWGVRLRPLGAGMSSHGLHIDDHARVLGWDERPIDGLCATGNAVAFTELPFGYQDGFANARNITYAYIAAQTAAAQS